MRLVDELVQALTLCASYVTQKACELVCIDLQHVPTSRDLAHYCKITSVLTSVLFPGGC